MSTTQKLYDLFMLDGRVRAIESRLDAARRRLEIQESKLSQAEQQHTEMEDQLKHVQARASDLEKQSDEYEQRINEHREQMNAVTNNKQYSALLIEVNTFKVEKDKLEEEALEQLGQIDVLKEELSQIDERVEDQKKIVSVASSEMEQCKVEVADHLQALTEQRTSAEKDLPASVIDIFRRVSKVHEGEAVATVVEENRRTMEYSCGGCYLSIPVERVNGLMSTDDVVLCPNCGRMLIIDQDLKTAIAK
ncbi:MAG: hypothetical protein CMJ18_21385 [Phycisphaeraceae bacterium]|nr:hypothetical protein [Phycisphaeraceae bacterium]